MEIQRVPDPETLSSAAAGLFVRLARRAVDERGLFTVALSGGATPRGVYECLSAPRLRNRVPWDKIEFFWGDERPVPQGHADSNYRMARNSMLASVPVTPARIHRMAAERRDLGEAAAEYERVISQVFGVAKGGPPPSFDLIFLGIGADGHVASLFPHTPALDTNDRWVVANPVPVQSTPRMTLTLPVLNRARCVCFLVSGAGKAETLGKVLEGPLLPEEWPSQRVRPTPGRLIWLVDRAAATELKGEVAGRPRLAPSILGVNVTHLCEQVRAVERAGVDRIHVDVMDGHFVPNVSMGPEVMRPVRRMTDLPLETHLMVSAPQHFIEPFADAGSDSIIFHCEAASDPHALITRVREFGMGVGMTLRPSTPAGALEPFLRDLDIVLVMTVEPGLGGQRFLTETLQKVSWLRAEIDRVNPICELGVDGGITVKTAPEAFRAGARVFVAGSSIFASGGDVARATERLRNSIGPPPGVGA